MKIYKVGGCVRDKLLELPVKDIDFAVELDQHFQNDVFQVDAESAFEEMVEELKAMGFKVHLETPDKLTVRAQFPTEMVEDYGVKDADFVLCRKEGPYLDNRRPSWVSCGTLADDLARRDFTINAMAEDPDSHEIIDPHKGQKDIASRTLRFVGNPEDRIEADGLRIMRGLRFALTKDLKIADRTKKALHSERSAELLGGISANRRYDELKLMLDYDQLATIAMLNKLPDALVEAIFAGGLRLTPTLKES